ncbi:TIGR04255 family protein [Microbacterium sp. Marseille-Q6648]|uniref:TIGR04255 family protein n=1 Tax=Microbacterium sp. Marseille-Q6648 TaxID=2937991 RepID=UPI0020418D8E|nr:TIGR04255 family protein [Microbacterium sp. Marseille-Q6648]
MTNRNESPSDVPALLTQAPLARVLVQVRWPELSSFDLESVATAMARQLSDSFPLKRREPEVQLVFTPAGPQQQANGFVHRLTSAADDWTISLGASFIALETSAYQGHGAFVARLRSALLALNESAKIPVITRIGYRYTNRIVGADDLARLSERFAPSVLGGLGDAPKGSVLVHTITESVYRFDNTSLLVRSAQVGANESIDPTLAPVKEMSWILDLDAYDESRVAFAVDSICERAEHLSGIASGQFHALTTEEFTKRYA